MRALWKTCFVAVTGAFIATALTSVVAKHKQVPQSPPKAKPVTVSAYTYCPKAPLIKTLCDSKEPYQKQMVPFPECLTLALNDTVKTADGFTWQLASINPPSLSNGLHFIIANVDQLGTHCVYQTDNPNEIVIFTLINAQRLTPSFNPLLKDGVNIYWKADIQTRYHTDLYNPDGDQGNILTCKPKKVDPSLYNNSMYPPVTDCPFINPNFRAS